MNIDGELGRYEPIEFSNPEFERDGLRQLAFYSPALQGRGDVSLFLPDGIQTCETVPIVLLLHGVYGSHWSWFWQGGAHATARRFMEQGRIGPMAIVAPFDGLSGDGTGYLPAGEKNFEAWICDDVVQCVPKLICGHGQRAELFLAGLSMGGYGALRLGAKYPRLFRGIAAHSAIVDVADFRKFVRDASRIESVDPAEAGVLHWMRKHKEELPPIRFDCGEDDDLFASNSELHRALQQENIAHEFISHPGGHSWEYWRLHVEETLLFFDGIVRGAARQSNSP
jgi:enterochelin esterase-like enzyme